MADSMSAVSWSSNPHPCRRILRPAKRNHGLDRTIRNRFRPTAFRDWKRKLLLLLLLLML